MFIYSILFSEIAIGAIYSAIYDTLMQGREHKSNYIISTWKSYIILVVVLIVPECARHLKCLRFLNYEVC